MRAHIGLALKWAGYAWIALLLAAHFLGELLGPWDLIEIATTPIRFVVTLILCIPGIVFVLWGKALSGPVRPR